MSLDNPENFLRLFTSTGNMLRLAPEEAIFREGERGDRMYIVVSGQARIEVGGKYVDTIGPGGIVGEMALLDDSPRSASAIALEECELVPVDEERFLYLVTKSPEFALHVMRIMADRLRGMNELMSDC